MGPDRMSTTSLPITVPHFQALPSPSTPAAAGYDIAGLTWNAEGTQNTQNRYGYTGRQMTPLQPGQVQPCLRCSSCRQWFFYDELGEGLLPAGFLPFQRNYRFSCAWCPLVANANSEIESEVGVESLLLTKPFKFEAIVDAMVSDR